MIRAVLFDLDDTLVDHRHAFQAAIDGVRERYGELQRIPADELAGHHGRLLDELHEQVAIGRASVDVMRIERYRRIFALAGSPASVHCAAAAQLHRELYQASRRAIPGAVELLHSLRPRVRIAVVTNNTRAEQLEKLATFGLAPHVDAIVTSEEMGFAKPDARIFAAALACVDCKANEAVMVGDSLANDVEGALRAGLSAVWFDRWGASLPAHVEVPVLSSLEPAEWVAERILACATG